MEVTITLIICLSVVFIITLGIISYTLRDKNFKARFDKSNERLKRIIKEQHDELISYREAIKKNDANLKESLKILASASDVIKTRMSRLKDTEETLSMLKVEVAELNLGKDKSLKKIDEAIRSFSESAERIVHKNETEFKWLDECNDLPTSPLKRRRISWNICKHVLKALTKTKFLLILKT